MSSAALPAHSASDAALPHVVFKVAHTALAIGIVAAAVFAVPNGAMVALAGFDGPSILAGHGLAPTLGRETIAAVGAPTASLGWLGDAAIAAVASAGAPVQTLVAAFVALITFGLFERRARRMAGPAFGIAATALAALCSIGAFGFAGGLVTALFTVALAEILDRPGKRAALFATLLAVLWCNVSPQGLFAPAIALVFALGARFEQRTVQEQSARWIAFAGTLVAVFATPGTFAYPGIAFEDLRMDRALDGIVFFNPVDVAPLGYRIGFVLSLFAAFAVGLRTSRIGDVLLYLVAGLLALANGAYLPVFAMLALPLLASSAQLAFPLPDKKLSSARGDVLVGIASVVAAAVLVTSLVPRTRPASPAFALAAAVAHDARPHRLFCLHVDYCNAALVEGSKTRVFMDGRIGAYPTVVRDDEYGVIKMQGAWRKTLERYRIDAILAGKDRQLATLIALTPGWKTVASDDIEVLYERAPVSR